MRAVEKLDYAIQQLLREKLYTESTLVTLRHERQTLRQSGHSTEQVDLRLRLMELRRKACEEALLRRLAQRQQAVLVSS